MSLDWFQWLPASGVSLFRRLESEGWPGDHLAPQLPAVALDRHTGERLAAIDRNQPSLQRSLRVGWLFVAGRQPVGNIRMQRVFFPLLSLPVRIVLPPLLGDALTLPAGDVSVNQLVSDPAQRHESPGRAGEPLRDGSAAVIPAP